MNINNNFDHMKEFFPHIKALSIDADPKECEDFPYLYNIEFSLEEITDKILEIAMWSIENFGNNKKQNNKLKRWVLNRGSIQFVRPPIGLIGWTAQFCFKFEEDYMAFKLRWS